MRADSDAADGVWQKCPLIEAGDDDGDYGPARHVRGFSKKETMGLPSVFSAQVVASASSAAFRACRYGAVALRLHNRTSEDDVRQQHSYLGSACSAATLLGGLIALLSIGGCRQGVPVLDPGDRPAAAAGTISGTVRGPAGAVPLEGRTVEIVNVETGVRERATTNNSGGFTVKVAPGKYRVELRLLDGETLVKQPGVITVNRSDVDAHADFVLATSRIARPRFAAPRTDNGLGPPIA